MARHLTAFKTRVRNISGVEKTFTFLGPRGKGMTLAAGQAVDVAGDLLAAITAGNGGTTARKVQALLNSISRGELRVMPAPPFFADEDDRIVELKVRGDDVIVAGHASFSDSGGDDEAVSTAQWTLVD